MYIVFKLAMAHIKKFPVWSIYFIACHTIKELIAPTWLHLCTPAYLWHIFGAPLDFLCKVTLDSCCQAMNPLYLVEPEHKKLSWSKNHYPVKLQSYSASEKSSSKSNPNMAYELCQGQRRNKDLADKLPRIKWSIKRQSGQAIILCHWDRQR